MKRLLFLLALTCAAAQANIGGYLFVTFRGEATPLTEQIYFCSSKDGLHWDALNEGEPVLVSKLGEKGVRDPYLVRAHDGKTFYLIATDLSIHLNHGWKRAVEAGSKSIVIWESSDLVKWSEPRLVKIAADDAGCTWAPEAIYDEQTQDYLVYWASKTASDQFQKHRIWAARTKDFKTFGKPFIYIDNPQDVIDTDIIRENDVYYRFSKDEKFKAVTLESSKNLMGPWTSVPNFSLEKLVGYEGPAAFPLDVPAAGKPTTWCLLLDLYSKKKGYQPYITKDIASGKFEPAPEVKFPFLTRHGAALSLSTEEYERVNAAYKKAQPAR